MSDNAQTNSDHAGPVFVIHESLDRLEPHPETSHTEHGLTYLAEGRLEMVQGDPITIGPGTVTIVPAGVPHTPVGGREIEYWLASFCATCLRLDESQPLMSPFRRVRAGALPVIQIPESRRWRVVDLFSELESQSERGSPESAELSRSLLLLLLAEVRDAMPGSGELPPRSPLVSEALEFVQANCLEPISPRDVAAAIHLTPAHVTSTLKKETGYSLGEWITAGRMAEAASRLAHTDSPVDEIAGRVGLGDTTHFIRQFRRAYGSTPAAWRRDHRDNHVASG